MSAILGSSTTRLIDLGDGKPPVEIVAIRLWEPWTECHICGADTPVGWGVPVWNGFVVANDWPGEWGGVPACESCHDRHALGEFVEVPTSDYRPGM